MVPRGASVINCLTFSKDKNPACMKYHEGGWLCHDCYNTPVVSSGLLLIMRVPDQVSEEQEVR